MSTGRLNLLVSYAEKLLRKNPQYVVYLGPLCTYSLTVLKITIPATFIGVMAAATWSLKRGKDLDKDQVFLEKMKDPEFAREAAGDMGDGNDRQIDPKARKGLFIFPDGILAVILVAVFSKSILP